MAAPAGGLPRLRPRLRESACCRSSRAGHSAAPASTTGSAPVISAPVIIAPAAVPGAVAAAGPTVVTAGAGSVVVVTRRVVGAAPVATTGSLAVGIALLTTTTLALACAGDAAALLGGSRSRSNLIVVRGGDRRGGGCDRRWRLLLRSRGYGRTDCGSRRRGTRGGWRGIRARLGGHCWRTGGRCGARRRRRVLHRIRHRDGVDNGPRAHHHRQRHRGRKHPGSGQRDKTGPVTPSRRRRHDLGTERLGLILSTGRDGLVREVGRIGQAGDEVENSATGHPPMVAHALTRTKPTPRELPLSPRPGRRHRAACTGSRSARRA